MSIPIPEYPSEVRMWVNRPLPQLSLQVRSAGCCRDDFKAYPRSRNPPGGRGQAFHGSEDSSLDGWLSVDENEDFHKRIRKVAIAMS